MAQLKTCNPAMAQAIWQSMPNPSSRRVARKLNQAGDIGQPHDDQCVLLVILVRRSWARVAPCHLCILERWRHAIFGRQQGMRSGR